MFFFHQHKLSVLIAPLTLYINKETLLFFSVLTLIFLSPFVPDVSRSLIAFSSIHLNVLLC